MPELGRWGVVDPLAEVYSSYSPYHMVAGNPIMNIDLDGRSFETAIGSPMNDIRSMHPNVYSGWEYVDGVKMGDWNKFDNSEQFADYLSSMGEISTSVVAASKVSQPGYDGTLRITFIKKLIELIFKRAYKKGVNIAPKT